MQITTDQHISQTLRHMQRSVNILCWMAGLAFMAQLLTWSLVSFTDLRYDHLEANATDTPLVIVQGENTSPHPTAPSTVQNIQNTSETEPVDPNTIQSKYGQWFQVLHQLAFVVGVAAIILLTIQISLGLIVSSIGPVTGISRVAAAQAWVLVLLALTFPWSSLSGIVENVPYPGIFSNYSTMCNESASYMQQSNTGQLASPILFFGRYALLPLACTGAVSLIHIAFASGIRGGIIPNTPSVFEQAIDAEATGQTATSLFSSGRTGGAFQHTLSQSVTDQPATLHSSNIHSPAKHPNSNDHLVTDRPVDTVRKPATPPAPDPRLTAVDHDPAPQPPARRPI